MNARLTAICGAFSRLSFLLPAAMLLAALALRAHDPRLVSDLRAKVFDTYQSLSPRPYQPLPVFVVDIDDESLSRLGQWPWPRTLLARLTDRLAGSGAAAIAFDILFAEPDRTSPESIRAQWRDEPLFGGAMEALSRLPAHDALFAEAIADAPAVLGLAFSNGAASSASAPRAGFAVAGDDIGPFVPRFTGAVTNLPALDEAATGYGALNFIPDHDGILRRVPIVLLQNEKLYPSLSAETLRVAQGAQTYVIKAAGANQEENFGANTGIARVRIGQVVAPTDAGGSLILYDTGHRDERFIPAWRLIEDGDTGGALEGAIVFVGTSAAGLRDFRTTPLAQAMPGVEVHVQMVEQLLLQQFLLRPDWADGTEMLYLLMLGLLVIVVTSRTGAAWGLVASAVAVGGALGASWIAFSRFGFLLAPVYPGIVILLVFVSSSVTSYLRKERERRQVRKAFSQYVSPDLVKELERNQDRLKLGGEMREMTILFCDIRGFTSISERFTATELTTVINRFLTPMTDLILGRGGTIDKYMGDCIMAFWNAPLPDPAHAASGCGAALAMRRELVNINAAFRESLFGDDNAPELKIGIGLNTGECCVGNMGSEQRFDYSVLGDSVNLASRLEGQSKTYGVDIVIGEATEAAAAGFATLELDLVRVKGKDRPVTIHALLGDRELARDPEFTGLRSRHGQMLTVYRAQEWDEAERRIDALEAESIPWGLSTLYALYRERIALYRESPPGPGWDFVTVAQTK